MEGARLAAAHGQCHESYRLAVPMLRPRLTSFRPDWPATPARWRWRRFLRNREYLMLGLEATLLALFAARALAP